MIQTKSEFSGFTLADIQRLVLALRVEGDTYDGIAGFLGCSIIDIQVLESLAIKRYKPDWAITQTSSSSCDSQDGLTNTVG